MRPDYAAPTELGNPNTFLVMTPNRRKANTDRSRFTFVLFDRYCVFFPASPHGVFVAVSPRRAVGAATAPTTYRLRQGLSVDYP